MSLIASGKYSVGIRLHPPKPPYGLAAAAVCAHETSRGAQGIGSTPGAGIWPASNTAPQSRCKENTKLKLKGEGERDFSGLTKRAGAGGWPRCRLWQL